LKVSGEEEAQEFTVKILFLGLRRREKGGKEVRAKKGRVKKKKTAIMADAIAEELVRLLRGISVSLTLKLSHFISLVSRYKNASSAGAAVGLAIALFCTWRYWWRMPRKRRGGSSSNRSLNHMEKRGGGGGEDEEEEDSSSSSSLEDPTRSTTMDPNTGVAAGGSSSSTAIAHSITQAVKRSSNTTTDSSTGSMITDSHVVPSVAKLVKQKLKGGRKMTCQLLGVILEQSSAEELQKHAAAAVAVRPQVVEVVLEIARACDLYLIARVLDDESEESVLAALDSVGFFTVPGSNRNKVLFCSTEVGTSSFVRQLEPDWHVDNVRETNAALAPFVRHQLHIAPLGASQPIASNVFLADSLEHFFGFPATTSGAAHT
jgi:hypothetical protein